MIEWLPTGVKLTLCAGFSSITHNEVDESIFGAKKYHSTALAM